jgi:predicted ribosome quality control (RQC) complex YloA/Tae2 family protein
VAAPSKLDVVRGELDSRIDREERRLTRRIRAVEGDLGNGREAEAEAERARLFVAEAARARRGVKVLRVTDWSSGEPVDRELPMDPAKQPREQVEAIFARARRLKRGAVVARARIEEARAKLARLAALREAVSHAKTLEDVAAAAARSHREDPALLGGLPRAPRQTRDNPPGRRPYRTFFSRSGARILVGRGAADNDELTLHVARPRDLWLHAKDKPGAHVVVPVQKGQPVSPEVLVDAGHLAAHFSDARGETLVDIAYADRRYVRKPRGSPPGLVTVDQERVIVLRVDEARLRLLLAREEEPR